MRSIKTPDRVERIAAPHLRILDPALWARNQARVAGNKNGTRQTGNIPTGLLVGNMRCAVCGSRMYVTGGRDKVYTCGRRHQCGASACDNGTKRPIDNLDEAVVAALLRVLDRPRLIDEILAACEADAPRVEAADERAALEARCTALRKELDNLTNAIATASNPTVIPRLVTLLDEKQAALDASTKELAIAKPVAAGPSLDPDALRARAHDKVVHLAEVLRRDIPAGREALRGVLASRGSSSARGFPRAPCSRHPFPGSDHRQVVNLLTFV